MSDLEQEIVAGIAFVREAINFLEEKLEREEDLPGIRILLAKLTSLLMNPDHLPMPPAQRGQPPRGIGFDRDEAIIVRSAGEHGSIRAAVEAFGETACRGGWGAEHCKSVADRIYRRINEIKNAGFTVEEAIELALSDSE